ncbi:MAG: acyl carrier protein [Clostridia bacterium]|nr:acyl carrier protein [Clostridia bacterium]
MVFEKIKKIVADQLGADADEITMESTFIEDLGADSLDVVELVMAMEDEFDMEIDEDEAENISTVGDVVEYIKANCDNL